MERTDKICHPEEIETKTSATAVIISLLSFPCLIVAFGIGGFVVNCPISRWYAPAAFMGMIVIACLLGGKSRARNCCIVVSFVILSLFISALPVMYCVSDAINCYRVGVAMMEEGWNPLVETEVTDISKYGAGFNPWHVAYALKIPFIYGASLCKALGFSGAGDSLNVIMLIAAWLCFYSWFHAVRRCSSLCSGVATLLILIAPNVVSMCFGGKSDPALYCCVAIALVACDMLRLEMNGWWISIIVLSTIIASGIKATGLICICIIVLVALASEIFAAIRARHCNRRVYYWCIVLFSVVAVSVLFNPSPIVTSTLKHGTPFYPMRTSEGKEVPQSITQMTNDCDIMNDDAEMLGFCGRYVRAYVSQSMTDALMSCRLKRPFNPEWPELFVQPTGFGSFFRFIFCIALIGWFFICDSSIKHMSFAIFLTTLAVPVKFVGLAHYVQQIYMFPVLVGVGLLLRFHNRIISSILCFLGFTYFSVLTLPNMCTGAYIWLSSVQSLQIIEEVTKDVDPVIESRYYYGQYLWTHDSCANVKVITPSDISISYANRKSYGPVARRYSYLRNGYMPEDYYDYNFKDVGRQQALRRENAASFFIRRFLPQEWRNVFLRAGQWIRLRRRQAYKAWVKQ